MPPIERRLLALTTVALLSAVAVPPPRTQAPATFAATIAQLSEPGGYFDTNNLISNEKSYLHVIPALREAGLTGGVYLGVGPDQNFSYIAQARPSVAFIIDVRRDNLLLHLLLKALFRLSADRAQYVSSLFGRPAPEPAERWKDADIERIVSYVADAAASPAATAAIRARVDAVINGFGVPLSDGDRATIDRFHRTFIERGPALRFESAGRPPRSYYPTYQELLLETDRVGRRWNYLARETDFQFVKSLQERDLVVGQPELLVAAGFEQRDRLERLRRRAHVNRRLRVAASGEQGAPLVDDRDRSPVQRLDARSAIHAREHRRSLRHAGHYGVKGDLLF